VAITTCSITLTILSGLKMNLINDTLTFSDWQEVGNYTQTFSIGLSILNNMTRVQSNEQVDLSDAFSKGQMCSKAWLADELSKSDADLSSVIVCGGWYGTLAPMLFDVCNVDRVHSVDIDEHCEKIANMMNSEQWHNDKFRAFTGDMYYVDYSKYTTIINTSCEHIRDIHDWLETIPEGKTVVLQSNNLYTADGHVNCVDDIRMFRENVSDYKVIYSGTRTLPDYSRFMLILRT